MISENVAVVIGNGESRSQTNLKELKNKVTLIGCNAIHRDMLVDHLVCCDQRMVTEVITRKKSHKISKIYTRERYFVDFNKLQKNRRVIQLPELPYQGTLKQDQAEHWGSGPYAVLLAAHLKFKVVYLIGFDLYGKESLVNNVYKGTQNYLAENKAAVDPAYWIYQNRKIFQLYPDTKFKIFNYENWRCPQEWVLPNIEVIDVKKFNESLAIDLNIVYNKSIEA